MAKVTIPEAPTAASTSGVLRLLTRPKRERSS